MRNITSITNATAVFSLLTGVLSEGIFTDFPGACSDLAASLAIENVTVNFATFVPAGTNLTFDQSGGLDTCTRSSQVVPVDVCRLAMKVATSNRSEITLEAWFPSDWSGRFLSTGNGGTSGCIQYEDLAYTAGMGFATVGGNNGHNGTSGVSWLNNADVVADFAYRSFVPPHSPSHVSRGLINWKSRMHTGVVVGKQITQTFYGEAHTKSYYLGCSTGGRQGFKAVQDFPEDFDGVVVGAPAIAYDNLTSWSGHFFPILGDNTTDTFVPIELWTTIHQMVLDQCDGIDGAVDGIIEDPLLCHPRPEALICTPGNTTNCLTSTQAASVREIYSDWYGVNGSLIYPRMQPGSEVVASHLYYTGTPFAYSNEWFRNAIFNDPNWDPATLSIEDAAFASSLDPSSIQTFNGNISAFQSRGGKVLHYHGQADGVISSENSPRYYNHVSQTMGLPSSSLDDFYRFFRVSGMGHCSGGDGAWQVGQTGKLAAGGSNSSQDNVLMRMVEWVEKGDDFAPETITGYKYVDDTVDAGVKLTRNHCKYPTRNYCTNPDAPELAESWKCI